MKALSSLMIIIGLILGTMTLYVSATPSINADMLIGGFNATGCPCNGTTANLPVCSSFSGCTGTITACDVIYGSSSHCQPVIGTDPCFHDDETICACHAACY